MNISDTKIGKWLAWFATVFGLFIVVIKDFIGADKNTSDLITSITVCTLLFLSFIILIVREITLSRKIKYVSINKYLHNCIHDLRDWSTFLFQKLNDIKSQQINIEDINSISINQLSSMLTELASAFSILTGASCRTAIKTIYEKNGRLYVTALARDKISMQENLNKDEQRYKDNSDPVNDNEDFEMLYSKFSLKIRCFFCNDLTKKRFYKNTSFKVYGQPSDNIDLIASINSIIGKSEKWTLPYKSTIVWPIQQQGASFLTIKHKECFGFLCIDSESRNVFNKDWDIYIGAEVADALYHPLFLYKEIFYLSQTSQEKL
jgi:hypothetical protein